FIRSLHCGPREVLYLHFYCFFSTIHHPPRSTLFPYTTLFRSQELRVRAAREDDILRDRRRRIDPRDLVIDCPAQLSRSGVEGVRSEEHTSELQSRSDLVCRLLLEKKKHDDHRPHRH